MDLPRSIRPASSTEVAPVADLLAEAFQDDPVSSWLFPDAEDRRRLQPGMFQVFVGAAVEQGLVWVVDDLSAASVWSRLDVDNLPGEEGLDAFDRAMRDACAHYADRWSVLGPLMDAAHPDGPSHTCLDFVGVRPDLRSQGLGARLIEDRLRQFDADGEPAYLFGSSPRSAQLYRRLGFVELGDPVDLPDGPRAYPMWRAAPAR